MLLLCRHISSLLIFSAAYCRHYYFALCRRHLFSRHAVKSAAIDSCAIDATDERRQLTIRDTRHYHWPAITTDTPLLR